MGLLRFSRFSQIPDLFKKIRFRTRERERVQQQISNDFMSNLVNNGKRITVVGRENGTNASELMYTVPEGKEFYLTSMTVTCTSRLITSVREAAISTSSTTPLPFAGRDDVLLFTELPARGGTDVPLVSSLNIGLTIPLKFIAGEQLFLLAGGSSGSPTSATVVGYEIDSITEKQRY